jgi:hypothetical protein
MEFFGAGKSQNGFEQQEDWNFWNTAKWKNNVGKKINPVIQKATGV